MTANEWAAIIERSDSLRLPRNEREARQAIRLTLAVEANAGNAPVGFVTDPRYLLRDGPFGHRDG